MTTIASLNFSDIYLTPDNILYISDGETKNGLQEIEVEDFNDFKQTFVKGWKGKPSYSINYAGHTYRVERVETLTGMHYSGRRMPKAVPDFTSLGLPVPIANHLISLNRSSGLILWGGATGTGKTTSISCLMRKYLEREGGFAYTIEDPPEMPLDGVYQSKRGGLGLCKQTEPPNGNWGDGIKSALRSRPHYIMVGEIRTPETASNVLRAAISGHLVLSTIHANSVSDAVNSLLKYSVAAGLDEDLAADLCSRGMLAVLNQRLLGTKQQHPDIRFCFANPDSNEADQFRILIRDRVLNLGTLMEAQAVKLSNGQELFKK